ncbi:regulatory protein RecX [Lysobacter psychrotolerans]|uniref:regulatory protein RecX n=1 Tax=Montanilutibacter psychrotolerans TaxID=1327343 RepID=UPI00168078D9
MGADPDDEGPIDGRTGRRPRKVATPTQRALVLLTRREHSRRELVRKLVARGLDAAEVDAAVENLAQAGWQDDVRFAQSLLRSRAGSGYGPVRVRAELQTHGLGEETVAQAFEAFEGSWEDIAADLVQRRFGADIATNPVQRRKAADLLYRRGFPADCVSAAIRRRTSD